MPLAILVIDTFLFSNIFFKYKDVVSASIPDFIAKIISLILSFSIFSTNDFISISFGPISSSGDIKPPRT